MSSFESFGKYVLLEKLATGGMAEVFLARGTGAGGIGKFFAIKRILPQYADSPEFIEMFKDEAKIAINLNHSNIVSIHEFGVEKGQFFLVMDYVEGRNLRQILNKLKKSSLQFSIDQIVYMIKEVSGGLDHAHRCIDGSTGKPLNITHRDMSPQNVMLSFEGEVKIVDFGIAKAESQIETTRAGTLKGKFGYMSPEQAEGQPVDLRTDIFSLGICMWELLANDRLFVANNEINTLRKIRDCQIPSLRKINPNIHTELERIVQKALARDRNLRYQTGAALHRDLNRFLNRQYPDFSPQDFAVFVKSVFADEILSLRKRLVDYSKVNLTVSLNIPTGGDKDFSDRTSLLNTSTNSLVISGSSSELNALVTGSNNQSDSKSSPTAAPPPGRSERSEPSGPSQVSFGKQTNTDNSEKSASTNGSLVTPTPQTSNSFSVNTMPPVNKPAPSSLPVLDEKALAAEMSREISIKGKMPVQIETEEVSSPSIKQRPRSSGVTRTSMRVPPPMPKKPAKPARYATILVFVLLCFSMYAYLVKFYSDNPTVKDWIALTDPYLHSINDHLIDRKTDQGSTDPRRQVPQPASTPTLTAAPAKPGDHAPAGQADETSSGVIVTSNPSGAEVWINDKSTGYTTPCRIDVPKGTFTIRVRRFGYQEYRMHDASRDALGGHFVANLVKLNVAYIDIEIFPPQDAKLYINGKKLVDQHGSVRNLSVTANVPLHIRAENKNGTSYDEVTVTLPVDRRQTIQLNPRKPLRLPTSASPDSL